MNSFLLNLVMQLVAGAVGGNAAGAMLKQFNLGPVGTPSPASSEAGSAARSCTGS